MLKAVAYIRNDERYLQRIEIENYCKRNAIDLEATFYDEGASGLDEDRASYQKLFKYISKNKVDLVLVYKPEKLTRDMNKIKEAGYSLETPVLVTNYADLKEVKNTSASSVQLQETLIEVKY